MKKFYLLMLASCLFTTANAQIINFPDANFKAKLLQASTLNSIAKDFSGDNVRIDNNLDGEIQIGEAALIYYLQVPFTDIANLTGVSNFVNLQELQCQGNHLTVLDVSSLTNLRKLACNQNQLTVLNVNGLTNLTELECESNQLSTIDLTGLVNISRLDLSFNQFSTLNVNSLTNLTILNCSNNTLTSLNISNLINLTVLYCFNNQISSLDVSTLINLITLDCYSNLLSSLNVNGLVALEGLWCYQNQISSIDLTGLTNLQLLDCHYNQLTSLNLSGNQNLWYLDCSNNQLTSLNLSGNQNLTDLFCRNNQFTSLDLNGLAALENLNCSNNPLEYLFLKNNSEERDVDYDDPVTHNDTHYPIFRFNNTPNLRYICADDFQVNAIQNKINEYGYTNCHVNTYCSFVPGGEFYTIQGNYKFDGNNNGCDVSDSAFQNLKFSISDGTNSGTFISDISGNYSISVQAGTHTITPILENSSYFTISQTYPVVNFPTQTSPLTQDFCVDANGVHPDLEIALLPSRPSRPGFDAIYKLVYKNKGTVVQSGNINLTFNDAVLDFVSANPATSNQVLNNLSWDFTNLQPLETREITLTLNVNSPTETPAVNGGDVLNYTATITSIATDEMPDDNTFALNQTVVNSFDPNDKTCLEGATIAPSEVGKYVHYMIRFENTGTFLAENIVVKDMIDTNKFDINSLVPLKGSHSFVTNITSGNKVEFIFENINLPFDDANNDGYVAFKVKTKPTLAVGNTFSNSASIYFDYNFPIVTNTATTTIAALNNQDFSFATYFMLYPNPVNNVLNIETKQTIEVSSINIYNQLGQLVLVVPNAQNVSKVDVSGLASGNYFIKVNSDKGTSNTKFIKH